MADRINANLFGRLFETLAAERLPRSYGSDPRLREQFEEDKRALAQKLMELAGDYDFSPYQMEADRALVTLGVAKPWNEGHGDAFAYHSEEEFERPSPAPPGTAERQRGREVTTTSRAGRQPQERRTQAAQEREPERRPERSSRAGRRDSGIAAERSETNSNVSYTGVLDSARKRFRGFHLRPYFDAGRWLVEVNGMNGRTGKPETRTFSAYDSGDGFGFHRLERGEGAP